LVTSFQILSFASFYICGLLLLTAHDLIILLFTPKWEPSVILFQILIAGAFASQIFSLFYNVLIGTGKIKKYLYINIFFKIILITNYLTLFFSGLVQYLIIFSSLQIILLIVVMLDATHNLGLKNTLFSALFKYFSCSILSVLFSFLIGYKFFINNDILHLMISTISFSLAFFIMMRIFKCDGYSLFIKEFIKPLWSLTMKR
jgi:teichuronic acid exporter